MQYFGKITGVFVVLFWFLWTPAAVSGNDVYSVDGRPVLLYKVINFWYTCLERDREILCGLLLTCENYGNVVLDYDQKTQQITFRIPSKFGELVCAGGTARSTFLDPEYFSGCRLIQMPLERIMTHGIEFHNASEAEANKLSSLLPDLGIVMRGSITGLSNGRIALAGCQDMIKSCRVSGPTPCKGIRLDIICKSNGRRLAGLAVSNGSDVVQ